jgi:hypothetical protein
MSKILEILNEKEDEIKDAIRTYFERFIDEEEDTFDDIQFEYSSNDGELLVEIGEEFFDGDVEALDDCDGEEYDKFFGMVDDVIEEEGMELVKKHYEDYE